MNQFLRAMKSKRQNLEKNVRLSSLSQMTFPDPLLSLAVMPLSVQGKANLRLPTITLPVKRSLHDRHNLYQIAMGVFDNNRFINEININRKYFNQIEFSALTEILAYFERSAKVQNTIFWWTGSFSFHSDDVTHEQYIEAQNFGSSGGDGGCAQKYSACEFSIFHSLILVNDTNI
ncbi:hypothetical protein Avbf_06661 [Armadillidium vulgare]|nr:hypothetical protein Avbf_06661 [Armadillidium vulgare]